jgi:hypothetical protein
MGTWASALWVIAVGVPSVARALLRDTVSTLRDAAVDELILGHPSTADGDVRRFVEVTQYLVERPEAFGLTEAWAAHESCVGCPRPAAYTQLTSEQRAKMVEREKLLLREIARYLVFGSRFWPLVLLVVLVLPVARALARRRTPMTSPTRLAVDVRAAAALRLERPKTTSGLAAAH